MDRDATIHGNVDPDDSARLLPESPVTGLDGYLERGGGRALARARESDPDALVAAVSASGLRGRGGAGFPTGAKWRGIVDTARNEDLATAVVVNAAEGEPGTYKDRELLQRNPYALLEGALVAAHAVGAARIWIGIKRSATAQVDRLDAALDEIDAAGWVDRDSIEIVRGPDEYLFGEEKALLEVVEGRLPMPRHLAPFVNGLFASSAHPSVALVNNVETLANVPLIVADGPDAFRRTGTDDTPGTMLFTVTGDVTAAGVYELPTGTPLGTLLVDLAGADDLAFAFPGTSAGIITPDMLDTPLDHEPMRARGTALGSGGYVVYDSDHCVVRVAASLLHFLAIESCGQCNACVLGTAELAEIFARIDAGEDASTDLGKLEHWMQRVTDLARCGLPSGAQAIVASVLDRSGDEVRAHVGRPCRSPHEVPVPKIETLDSTTGEVVFDPEYHRKRSDWSYAD
jgi:NADH-quinone oxidoreductase subunit F